MDDAKNPQFDPSLSPRSEHNRKAAAARKIRYEPSRRLYVDEDGCATHDRFGQRL